MYISGRPVSVLEDTGCYFDFYGAVGLTCGDIFLPFVRKDGLYLTSILTVPFDSLHVLIFGQHSVSAVVQRQFSAPAALVTVLPVITCSMILVSVTPQQGTNIEATDDPVPHVLAIPVPVSVGRCGSKALDSAWHVLPLTLPCHT